MINLLFNPQGRIEKGPFWTGFVVLLVVGVAVGWAQAYAAPQRMTPLFTAISLTLIYPSVCVYGKRFHDAGKTAWFFGAVVVAQIIGNAVAALVIAGPHFAALQDIEPGTDAFRAAQREITQTIFLPVQLAATTVAFVVAFVVSMLPSDPDTNRFGPPPGGPAQADEFA